jgi:hypothetical protein
MVDTTAERALASFGLSAETKFRLIVAAGADRVQHGARFRVGRMFLYRHPRNRAIRGADWQRHQQPEHERTKDQLVSHRSPPSIFAAVSRNGLFC